MASASRASSIPYYFETPAARKVKSQSIALFGRRTGFVIGKNILKNIASGLFAKTRYQHNPV